MAKLVRFGVFSLLVTSGLISSAAGQIVPSQKFKKEGLKIIFYEEKDGKQNSLKEYTLDSQEELDAAYEHLEKGQKVYVTTLIYNPAAIADPKLPKMKPDSDKKLMIVQKDRKLVERPPTEEEKKELADFKAKALEEGKPAKMIESWEKRQKYYEVKEIEREYLGSMPYPDPEPIPGVPGAIQTRPLPSTFVFKNASGQLEFYNDAGHALVLEPKWVKKEVVTALEADLKANKNDPTKMRYQLDVDGNIIDTTDPKKPIVVKADEAAQFALMFNLLDENANFNLPIEKEMTPKEYIEALTKGLAAGGDLEEVQSLAEYKNGLQEIWNVQSPKAPAQPVVTAPVGPKKDNRAPAKAAPKAPAKKK